LTPRWRIDSPRILQNLTENGESPTFFRSIASKKTMVRGRLGGAEVPQYDIFFRQTQTSQGGERD
jgi:hypothetical protein